MAANEHKAIKRLKKQVKKLEARIDDMRRQINGLRDATGTGQIAADLQKESAQGAGRASRFSEEEVEMADEITEEAEEVADLLEKSDR